MKTPLLFITLGILSLSLCPLGLMAQSSNAKKSSAANAASPIEPTGKGLIQKMERLVIPEINFENATLGDVLNFLTEVSRERDPRGLGINLIDGTQAARRAPAAVGAKAAPPEGAAEPQDNWFFPNADDRKLKAAPRAEVPRVTLNLRRVTMRDALDLLTDVTDTEWYVKKNVVIIRPKGAVQGNVQTRTYPLNDPKMLQEILRNMQRQKQGGRAQDPFLDNKDPFDPFK